MSIEGVDRYNPENIGVLEKKLEQQDSYDLNSSLALLKLYQFNPDQTKIPVVKSILSKALAHFPEPDFSLCLSLLPGVLEDEELGEEEEGEVIGKMVALRKEVTPILNVADALERADFVQVWKLLGKDYPELHQPIRNCIAETIANAAQVVRLQYLAQALHLESQALNEFSQSRSWVIEGELVKIPLNRDNQAKTNTQQQLTKLHGQFFFLSFFILIFYFLRSFYSFH